MASPPLPIHFHIMKSLKFLRNVAVYGIHREQGSVHDIEDKDAVMLVADRAADYAAAAVKETIETAEAKRPAKESASRK